MARKALPDKQARFVEEYLIDLNATQAAIRAGYSEKTARQQAYQLLGRAHIQDAILEAKQRRTERTEVTQDAVVEELRRIAFSLMTNVASWSDGSVVLKDSADLPEEVVAAVAEINRTASRSGVNVKVKLHSKLKALELLLQHTAEQQRTDPGSGGNYGEVLSGLKEGAWDGVEAPDPDAEPSEGAE